MPVITKRMRRGDPHPIGTQYVVGECNGHDPNKAWRDAMERFIREFGEEPEQDERLLATIFFTTFETRCELARWPEGVL